MERQRKRQQVIIDVTSLAYQNFINSIKSKTTRYIYSNVLRNYLIDNKITIETLVNLPIKDNEQLLINYLEKLKSNEELFIP